MYQKTTLENGIRIVTETNPAVRSVAIGILIDAGPRDEIPEQRGLAHLVEHAMFQGTSSRDAKQIAHFMDVGGGNMGAFTGRDYTCYFATVLDDYRTYALDLLGDILLNAIFPAEVLEKEKAAILRELDADLDTPYKRVNMLLKASIWPDHPLGYPILGYPETIRNLTREDVIYFAHKHYLPDRMIVAAAGNLEHQDFVAQVRDAFWRLQGKSGLLVSTPPTYQSGVTIEHTPVSQAYFALGMRAYPYAHPDRYALHILSNILGGGISSRLYQGMREKQGLVYNIGSEYQAYRDGGILVVGGSTAPECLKEVLTLTLREIWQLITGEKPVNDEELWKAKMHIRGQHLIASESTNTCMSRLATQELYFGRRISTEEVLTQIESVDGGMLQRVANDILDEAFGQAMIAAVGPEATEHYCASSISELLAGFR